MIWYELIKPILFSMDAERAHRYSLVVADWLSQRRLFPQISARSNPQQLMGLTWPNPVGLAAGLDKNAGLFGSMAALGFWFCEVGTVTPQPQPGQATPRLFRLQSQQSLINRMGFNNKGVDYLVQRVERSDYQGILGINIGKNASTPLSQALQDYATAWDAVSPLASYITINISSPNTQGLRDLQHGHALHELLRGLKAKQAHSQSKWHRYVPMWVKVSPDLSADECRVMAATLIEYEVDAIVVANTTQQRPAIIKGSPHAEQTGGLSGQCLTEIAQQAMHLWAANVGGRVPLVGVGGIKDSAQAAARLQAGASLLQLYTALIYHGPRCVMTLMEGLMRNQA